MNWKLNRLLMPYAWKSVVFVLVVFLALYFLCEYLFSILLRETSDIHLATYVWCFHIMCLIIILFSVIDEVCKPVRTFFLENREVCINVYKEKSFATNNAVGYQLCIKRQIGKVPTEETLWVDDYCLPYYTSSAWFFIYRKLGSSDWYYKQAGRDAQCLGIRINKILFMRQEGNGMILSVLGWDSFKSEKVESYILSKDIHIPFDNDWKMNRPDDLICIKKNGVYECWGFFFYNELPHYQKLHISSLILRQGNQRIVLVANKETGQYTELCCKTTLSRELNNFVIEPTSEKNAPLKVKVLYYDTEKEHFVSQYEGAVCYMDFDTGEVLGGDGKTYGLGDNQKKS